MTTDTNAALADVLLTTQQLANRWQMHPVSLDNARAQGRGCPYVTIGRNVRYRASDVIAYETAGRVGVTVETAADILASLSGVEPEIVEKFKKALTR